MNGQNEIIPAMVIIPWVRVNDNIEVATLDPQTRQYRLQWYELIKDPAPDWLLPDQKDENDRTE